jgi:hypothetical protein
MSATPGASSPTLRRGLARPLLVALATTAALAAALPLSAGPLRETHDRVVAGARWETLPLDLVLASLASAALGLCGLWLAAVTLATTAEALTGRSWTAARAVTPLVVRRGVLALCGLAIGSAGLAVPATATPLEPGPAAGAGATLDGLPLPDRVEGKAPMATPARPSPLRRAAPVARVHGSSGTRTASVSSALPAGAEHRVQPGESLWSIAEVLLPSAGPAEVDRAWRLIYRANRPAVGDDPHLLLPGTALLVPGRLTDGGSDGPRRTATSPSHRKDAS